MFVCVPAGGLWRCDRVLDRSRRAMSVSVSRIGQSFDRSVNRLVDQSISHDSLVSLLINHSVSVGACTHLPALAPLVRSGCPLYSYTYIIYTMMLPNFFLTWPSSKKKREKKRQHSSNESIHLRATSMFYFAYMRTVSAYGRHCLVCSTFNWG